MTDLQAIYSKTPKGLRVRSSLFGFPSQPINIQWVASLDDIKKATNATVNTVDSVTKQPYTYTTDGKSYTLKANLYSDSDCQSKVYQVVDGVSGCQ